MNILRFSKVLVKGNIKRPLYWPFVEGIHRSPVDSPHKGSIKYTFDVSSIIIPNKVLDKWSSCQRLETSWSSCDITVIFWFYLTSEKRKRTAITKTKWWWLWRKNWKKRNRKKTNRNWMWNFLVWRRSIMWWADLLHSPCLVALKLSMG